MTASNPPSESSDTPNSKPAVDRVHVTVVLDRSGSMASVADDAIGGFNTFVKQQAEAPGECRVTLVQFDSHDPHDVVFDAIPPQEVVPLTDRSYQPRGGTPLLDAVGSVIQDLDKRVAIDADEEQLVAIITDGHENSSRRFSKEEIAGMITLREKGNWAFMFLGADIDAFGEAGAIGVGASNSAGYDRTSAGISEAFGDVSRSSLLYRSMNTEDRMARKRRLMEESRAMHQRAVEDPDDRT